MNLSIVNRSAESPTKIKAVIAAINAQVQQQFGPAWSISASVRASTAMGNTRPDGILYLQDEVDVEDALGYHDETNAGMPYGVVFTALADELGEDWSVTLSHEVLELLLNPLVNAYSLGEHPEIPGRVVAVWREACDAVQASTYTLKNVTVSNFVMPHYFTWAAESGIKNDFLGRKVNGSLLESLGTLPGGYFGYYDPIAGEDGTFFARGDKLAEKRMEVRSKAQKVRRAHMHGEIRRKRGA